MQYKLTDILLLTSSVSVICAIGITTWLVCKHLANFTKQRLQSKTIVILYLVPIYGISSLVSLLLPSSSIYFDLIRDSYDAYAFFSFITLVLSYLGCDEDEFTLATYLETGPAIYLPFPLYFCCSSELPRGNLFIRYFKFGTMQYCFVRLFAACAATVIELLDNNYEFEYDMRNGYTYVTVLLNLSMAYAAIVLYTFFSAVKYRMDPYDPRGKFASVVFVSYFITWQGLILYGLTSHGDIPDMEGYRSRPFTSNLQDMIICLEVLLIAIVNTFAYSYLPFVAGYDLIALSEHQLHSIEEGHGFMSHMYPKISSASGSQSPAQPHSHFINNSSGKSRQQRGGGADRGGGGISSALLSSSGGSLLHYSRQRISSIMQQRQHQQAQSKLLSSSQHSSISSGTSNDNCADNYDNNNDNETHDSRELPRSNFTVECEDEDEDEQEHGDSEAGGRGAQKKAPLNLVSLAQSNKYVDSTAQPTRVSRISTEAVPTDTLLLARQSLHKTTAH